MDKRKLFWVGNADWKPFGEKVHDTLSAHSNRSGFMQTEMEQLAQRASGKMRRMIGPPLPGEDPRELERLAIDDEFAAQNGYVALKQGDKVFYKHIEEITHSDRPARLAYERWLVRWLRGRIEGEKIAAQLQESK